MNSCHTIIRIFPVQPYHYKYLYSREASDESKMPSKIRKIFFEQFTPPSAMTAFFSKYRGYENSFTRDDTYRQVLTKKDAAPSSCVFIYSIIDRTSVDGKC